MKAGESDRERGDPVICGGTRVCKRKGQHHVQWHWVGEVVLKADALSDTLADIWVKEFWIDVTKSSRFAETDVLAGVART